MISNARTDEKQKNYHHISLEYAITNEERLKVYNDETKFISSFNCTIKMIFEILKIDSTIILECFETFMNYYRPTNDEISDFPHHCDWRNFLLEMTGDEVKAIFFYENYCPEKQKQILFYHSWLGKMKDTYHLHLLTTKNTNIIFRKCKKSEGFYILLYSLIIDAFRNPYMDLYSRIMVLDFILYELLTLLNSSSKLPSDIGIRKKAQSAINYILFSDKIALIKLVNTIIAVYICLGNSTPEDSDLYFLGLEHLLFHPGKQYFGQ